MPKTIKNSFDKNLTFEKLMQAHKRAKKNKSYKSEVIKFELNLENNICNLLQKIKNNQYHLGKYFQFNVYEPKERVINALPYVDRIVHQWYIEEFIKPNIIPKLIFSTYACISGRGTHKAVENVQNQIRKYKRKYENFWILKCDISKFFYSINPYILFDILKKYISDKKLLKFSHLLIFDNQTDPYAVGIPIGNYTSQFFANIYLNELDQFVKRILKIECYTRYMDDFIILARTKNECIYLKKEIESFLDKNLQLKLNNKSRYYPCAMGVNFCGYRIFATHKLLRLSSKKKIKRNVKKWNYLYSKNQLDFFKTSMQIKSWEGHSGHCNSYNLKNKVLNSCNFLVNDSFFENTENYLVSLIENDIKKM